MLLYFVSDKNFDGDILYPKLPKNHMEIEDKITPRICVSPSINGCLTSVGRFKVGDRLYVHSCYSDDFYQPTISEVLDAPLTGELWLLKPTRFDLQVVIEITDVLETFFEGLQNYSYGFKILQ